MYMTPRDQAYFANYPYVGKEAKLVRSQDICDVRNDISERAFRTTKLDPSGSCQTPRITIPAGTPVIIEEARPKFTPMYGNTWYALGHLNLVDKTYSFEYRFPDPEYRAKFPPPWVTK
jgi:hypothetical protein